MSLKPEEKRCPFCGEANGCAASEGPRCWCATEEMPKALKDLVPEPLRMKACICLRCVRAFKANPSAFASQHCSH